MSKIKYQKTNFIYKILNLKPIVLLSNFVVQGARYMSLGERMYKLSITFFSSSIVYLLIKNLLLSLFIGHTLNYIFNGQFFVVYRYLGNDRTMSKKKLNSFINKILISCDFFSPEDVLYTGSFCRGKMSKTSDLDIRIFHSSNFIASLKAYFMATYLRSLGLFYSFPIDVFCFSKLDFLDKLDSIEIPVNTLKHRSIINKYPNSLNFSECLKNIHIE